MAVLVALPVALWGQFLASDRLLSGLTIGHEAVASSPRLAAQNLRERADVWESSMLAISIGQEADLRRATRGELGATLPIEAVLREAGTLGRSGNPLLDAGRWLAGLRGRLDLRWVPDIDAQKLARFVEREQARFERLPVAGITDGQGFTLPGRDGRALDHATVTRVLRGALRAGVERVEVPVQVVPAPPPIAMGSPDGALFADEELGAPEPPPSVPSVSAHESLAFQPANDDDCFSDPPQRPFCDGPRKVPVPHGPASALAERLGLGKLETVGKLMRDQPPPAWVQAAGGPGSDQALFWPVDHGKLGRGFGFVRRAELRDRIHAGIDIVAPRGSPIRAAAEAIVAYSDNRVRGYGNLLVMVHDSGAVTLYAHCQSIFVFAGERVRQGQVVAEVGATGLAQGPHLHFEYHRGGEPADPQPHFLTATTGAFRP